MVRKTARGEKKQRGTARTTTLQAASKARKREMEKVLTAQTTKRGRKRSDKGAAKIVDLNAHIKAMSKAYTKSNDTVDALRSCVSEACATRNALLCQLNKARKEFAVIKYGHPRGSKWCGVCHRWTVEDDSCQRCEKRKAREEAKAQAKEDEESDDESLGE